ncbi:MAG: hypothetical protein MZV63_51370 [Marinilabiliales bacterium]|nr:hypothetical protein [Marinilabiliales bacterium]
MKMRRGIFSSTRKGRGNDELYAFELPPLKFNVTGLVKDEKTGSCQSPDQQFS